MITEGRESQPVQFQGSPDLFDYPYDSGAAMVAIDSSNQIAWAPMPDESSTDAMPRFATLSALGWVRPETSTDPTSVTAATAGTQTLLVWSGNENADDSPYVPTFAALSFPSPGVVTIDQHGALDGVDPSHTVEEVNIVTLSSSQAVVIYRDTTTRNSFFTTLTKSGTWNVGDLGDWTPVSDGEFSILSDFTPGLTYGRDSNYYLVTRNAGVLKFWRGSSSGSLVEMIWPMQEGQISAQGFSTVLADRMPRLEMVPFLRDDGSELGYDALYVAYQRANANRFLGVDSSVEGSPMFLQSVGRIDATGPDANFEMTSGRDIAAIQILTAQSTPAVRFVGGGLRGGYVIGGLSPNPRIYQLSGGPLCSGTREGDIVYMPQLDGRGGSEEDGFTGFLSDFNDYVNIGTYLDAKLRSGFLAEEDLCAGAN